MDCSLSGSSVHGIFQARVLEWIAISFSRGLSRPRNRTLTAGRCFTVGATPFESGLSDSCDLYPAAEFSLLLKLQRLPIPCRPELRLLRIAFTGPQHSLFTLFQTDFTVLPSTCPLLGFFFYASSPFSFLPQILAQFSH